MLAASSADNGGQSRVFEKPFRGVFIIMPIAHLPVTAKFRRPEVSFSSFIVCILIGCACIRVAPYSFNRHCESSLFPDPHSFGKTTTRFHLPLSSAHCGRCVPRRRPNNGLRQDRRTSTKI